MQNQKLVFQDLTRDELEGVLLEVLKQQSSSYVRHSDGAIVNVELSDESIERLRKKAKYQAKQIYQWFYQRFVFDFELMSDLAKNLRTWLKENVEVYHLDEKFSQQALDGTHKFLWTLFDGKTIESVIIPAALKEKKFEEAFAAKVSGPGKAESASAEKTVVTPNPRQVSPSEFAGKESDSELDGDDWARLTVCISSQVGCAMACKFCLTGIQGLDRHLKTHEIVAQVWKLRSTAPITNIVFMGMGEPLHNYDAVVKACKIMLDQNGMSFSKRKITVSTSGLVPAIRELGKAVDISLAISLNASTDEQRSQIMPVNKRWPLAELMKACREYPLGSHRRITFEYVMLKDFNDSVQDAARVAELLRGIPSKINLIPFNEHPGSEFHRPSDEQVKKFQRYLLDRNLTTTVRISRGRDILAACGQLRSIFGSARGTEKHKDVQYSEQQ